MSFLDQLAKNLNSQTEFFAQLSNISKDSRANVDRKPELQVKQKSDLKLEKKSSNETPPLKKKGIFCSYCSKKFQLNFLPEPPYFAVLVSNKK